MAERASRDQASATGLQRAVRSQNDFCERDDLKRVELDERALVRTWRARKSRV